MEIGELLEVKRPNGKTYRPRTLRTRLWQDDNVWGGERCGAVVLGTHDVEWARRLAEAAIKNAFDQDYVASNAACGWFRLGYNRDGDPAWVDDDVRGSAGVMFTATWPDGEMP